MDRLGHVVIAALLGPLLWVRRAPARAFCLVILALVLTVLTQVGGLVLWLLCPAFAALGARSPRYQSAAAAATLFLMIYGLLSLTVVPPLAALAGRPALPCWATDDRPVQAVSPLFCLLNRHYATPPVHRMLDALAADLARRHPGTVVATLDAGFPFLDGFPLLPHLSHRHGRDLDLVFFYRTSDGTALPAGGAWPLGYWAYSGPALGEPQPCRGRETWWDLRWDLAWLQPLFAGRPLDEVRSRAALLWLVQNAEAHGINKIFLEPHLQARLAVASPLIRFQGCRAARHDDHLHVSLE